ncbi:Aste57867_3060 [Aphanomyces stellatus]|uniref:Aste57867_3060 protein n=1 Tax=Aphanomyces stellatus TaxID=120398 RepID=A0A485K9L1_9STRA|nr:hypothetical protein As57867_003051 [Aphanomyces stellatus]VFT80240.1 Aste57867_3060 [Aphanomyces stellatus]
MKLSLDALKAGKANLQKAPFTIFTSVSGARHAVDSDGTRRNLWIDTRQSTSFLVDTPHWQNAVAAAAGSRQPNTLKVITWNVWFDAMSNGRRFEALVGEVLKHDPDVLCLQEVTPTFSTALCSSAILTDMYAYSPFSINSYGCMILARKRLRPSFLEVPLPTRMDRRLLLCAFDGDKSVVATVHLESLSNQERRRDQLKVAREALAPYVNAILCGDFNFDDTQAYGAWRRDGDVASPLENNVLVEELAAFVDMWPRLHPTVRGATFDGKSNPICIMDRNEVMRYDRVLLKTSSVWEGAMMAILGTQAIDETGMKPSDHYGLVFECTVGAAKDKDITSTATEL